MPLKLPWTVPIAVGLALLVIVVAPIVLPDSWPFAILIAVACAAAYILLLVASAAAACSLDGWSASGDGPR